MYGGQSTHLPLKVNTAGVIPPIFASSLLIFPGTIAQFVQYPVFQQVSNYLQPDAVVYNLLYIGAIIFFCYFYTAVTFNPEDVAENMQKYGGFIPGIRPGKRTASYIDRILTRLTLGGAIYVAIVCVLPTFLIAQFNVPFFFGGTALLIVVSVAIDTVAQMQSHLIQRSYEGFMSRGKGKGRG
jgi:preprotein translocase subunit SecY